jgi:Fur family transcriptional regulator, ferric uptake regulator
MDVAARLRTEGYRMTPQRQLVWDVLRRSGKHLSAEEIHEQVGEVVPGFNLASVYRTLTLLAELGLANEVQLGDGRGYWEVAHADDVVHLHCRVCRRVDHHGGEVVAEIRAHLQAQHRFDSEEVDLVVHGVCPTCQAEATDR